MVEQPQVGRRDFGGKRQREPALDGRGALERCVKLASVHPDTTVWDKGGFVMRGRFDVRVNVYPAADFGLARGSLELANVTFWPSCEVSSKLSYKRVML